MKCANEKWKLKKILSCCFEEKKSKDQATNLPWMNLSLFSSQLGSAEEKPSERRFTVILCVFTKQKVCFEMGIYELVSCS